MLTGKVAVVTGAGRGIGRQIAEALAGQGARVLVNDKGTEVDASAAADPGVAAGAAQAIRDAGGTATSSAADITDHAAVGTMMQAVLDDWGRIDILVNAAGIIRDRMIWNVPAEEWDDVVRVHLTSCYTTTHHMAIWLRTERPAGDFSIITLSSSAGVFGNEGSTSYGAAKAGVIGFTRIAALELRRYGVRANCIVPFAWTRMAEQLLQTADSDDVRIARLRRLSPASVADLAVFLASDAASGITGHVLGMRGRELLVFEQPRIAMRMVVPPLGAPDFADFVGPRLRPHLDMPKSSGEIFDYDPHL